MNQNKKIIIALGLIVAVACIVFGLANKHEIELALFTDSAVLEQFRDIDAGDSAKHVLEVMGEPFRTQELNDHTVDGHKHDLIVVWIWPRYKGTSFAVMMVEDVVLVTYERYGS